MTSSSSSYHHDASSTTSTPRAGASSGSSYGNGNGNGGHGHGNGGHGNGNNGHSNGNGGHANGNGNNGHGNGNGNGGHGNGNGNGGNHHHHPPPHAPSSQAQALAVALGGPCVRLMCSFGGRILPRPGDHQLRYVGGETRIFSVPRTASHAVLTAALARLVPALFSPGAPQPTLRYQLPQDDLDSLISVSSDDDVDNLMDEIDRVHSLANTAIKPPRLRLFLFATSPDHTSAAAFGSVLSGIGDGSTDQWFVEQLNAPAPSSLERGRSEASSIVSENMDPVGLDATSDNSSPDTAAADAAAADPKSESDKEMAHGEDDNKPAPVLRDRPVATYVAETAPWPAPPPPYMQQQQQQHPVYFYPPRPVHYLDAAGRQCTYIPGPGYHIVGGGGNQVQGDLYASGTVGGVYASGPDTDMRPFRHQVVYAPPIVAADSHSAEVKPKEGGSQSHSS